MALIEVDGLQKTFTYTKKEEGLKSSFRSLFHQEKLTKEAVKGIGFSLEKGEMVGFLGPNGAGKTTTLKMLSGILYPTGGRASVMGYVPWERKKDFKMRFSIVMGQKSQMWWDLPAVESFALNRQIYEIDKAEYRKTLDELTETLNVASLLGVQVRRLSLGERMKMELIASLLHKPEVIFLDEPTIGLDFISQKRIREFLRAYNREKQTTVLLTSHSISDIEDLCQRTIVIADGAIVYDGALKKINSLFGARKRIQMTFETESAARQDLSRFGTVCNVEGVQVVLEVAHAKVREVSHMILDTLPVTDFNIVDIPVEEGIARLYARGNMP